MPYCICHVCDVLELVFTPVRARPQASSLRRFLSRVRHQNAQTQRAAGDGCVHGWARCPARPACPRPRHIRPCLRLRLGSTCIYGHVASCRSASSGHATSGTSGVVAATATPRAAPDACPTLAPTLCHGAGWRVYAHAHAHALAHTRASTPTPPCPRTRATSAVWVPTPADASGRDADAIAASPAGVLRGQWHWWWRWWRWRQCAVSPGLGRRAQTTIGRPPQPAPQPAGAPGQVCPE